MAHTRKRFIVTKVKKKLTYSPVIAIQGPRQTGKSFYAREILAKDMPRSKYLTFDQETLKTQAKRDIETFLESFSDFQPVIMDEAQKVSELFDAIKFKVDQKRAPGQFVLLGSTEFSKLSLIRESLTGRMTKVLFYPFTIAESKQLPHVKSALPFYLNKKIRINRKDFLKHLACGGFPGGFSLRDQDLKNELFQDWINLTCERDVHQFPKIKVETSLCKLLLKSIATLPEPNLTELSKAARTNALKVKRHLLVLQELFAIIPLEPHVLGTGKTIYYLPDVGLSKYLGADLQRQLETLFLQECSAKHSFNLEPKDQRSYTYFRTAKGSRVSFVEETDQTLSAISVFDYPINDRRSFYPLLSFEKAAKNEKQKKVKLFSFGPMELHLQKGVTHFIWESLG